MGCWQTLPGSRTMQLDIEDDPEALFMCIDDDISDVLGHKGHLLTDKLELTDTGRQGSRGTELGIAVDKDITTKDLTLSLELLGGSHESRPLKPLK